MKGWTALMVVFFSAFYLSDGRIWNAKNLDLVYFSKLLTMQFGESKESKTAYSATSNVEFYHIRLVGPFFDGSRAAVCLRIYILFFYSG